MEYVAFFADENQLTDIERAGADRARVLAIAGKDRLAFGGSLEATGWELLKDWIEESVGYREYEGDINLDEPLGENVSWIVHADAVFEALKALSPLNPASDPEFRATFDLQLEMLEVPESERVALRGQTAAIWADLLTALRDHAGQDKHLLVLIF